MRPADFVGKKFFFDDQTAGPKNGHEVPEETWTDGEQFEIIPLGEDRLLIRNKVTGRIYKDGTIYVNKKDGSSSPITDLHGTIAGLQGQIVGLLVVVCFMIAILVGETVLLIKMYKRITARSKVTDTEMLNPVVLPNQTSTYEAPVPTREGINTPLRDAGMGDSSTM